MNLQLAKYFSSIERGKNYILLNNLHRNILLVDKELYGYLINNDFPQIPETYLDELIENKFLYQNKIDEYKELLNWYKIVQQDLSRLNLCILTTNECNLSCKYCYEKNYIDVFPNRPDAKQINSAVRLLERIYNYLTVKRIDILFYGGEPLLNKEAIIHLINKINDSQILDRRRVYYSIFTNGTLLSPDIVAYLNLNNFDGVVISIDGTTNYKHQKRLFKDGRPSFKKTYNNLKYLYEHFNGKITLSIVVEEDNYRDLDHLFKMLNKDKMNNLFVQIAAINPTVKNQCIPENCRYGSEHQFKILNSCHISAMRNNIKSNYSKLFGAGPCSVRRKNHLILRADGVLHKCIGLLGYDHFSLGKIEDAAENFNKFLKDLDDVVSSTEIWKRKSCQFCKYLPLCLGGCRYLSYLEAGDITKPYCLNKLIENTELLLIGEAYNEEKDIIL